MCIQEKYTVIKNAQIVMEYGIIWDGIIVIRDGKIVQVGNKQNINLPEKPIHIDAKGLYVGPGFVDIHVHAGDSHHTSSEPIQAAEYLLRHG